jgi:SAM-dependent methyltransferase
MAESDLIAPVVEYYETKLASFGTTARGVDWTDESSQRKRFEQLVRVLRLDQQESFTILDFGCGYGALLPFLVEHGFRFTYVGYDRSPRMIAAARRQHRLTEARFTSEWAAMPAADFVVASGVFNVRLGVPDAEWEANVLRTLRIIDGKATAGWAVNFLTGYTDQVAKRDHLYYADPAKIFDWSWRSASRWVSLLHDYDLQDFTIGVVRRPW